VCVADACIEVSAVGLGGFGVDSGSGGVEEGGREGVVLGDFDNINRERKRGRKCERKRESREGGRHE